MANENDEMQQNSNSNGCNGAGDAATMAVTVEPTNVAATAVDGSTQPEKKNTDQLSTTTTAAAATMMVSADAMTAPTRAAAVATESDGDMITTTCNTRGNLTDLVADVCINDSTNRSLAFAFGDYTNIRATAGPVGYTDVISGNKPLDSSTNSTTQPSHIQQQQQQQQQQHPPPPTQNASSFSFKHFLNSSSVLTAPSSTVTSLDPVGPSSSASSLSISSVNTIASASTSNILHNSTGARPKVPQSASISSTTSISNLAGGGLSSAIAAQEAATTKMKRSPRFSSFDSQASLAEYTGAEPENSLEEGAIGGTISSSTTSGFRLYPDALGGSESNDFFGSRHSTNIPTAGGTSNSAEYERTQYVPRSYSNYDMPMPSSSASPRRRVGVCAAPKEARPTRLALNTNSSKLKLDLPIDASMSSGSSRPLSIDTTQGTGTASRPLPIDAVSDFPSSTAAASALPDFVQDHWMDSWYTQEMHLNSPPNSPVCDFVEDLTGANASGGVNVASGGCGGSGAAAAAAAAATCGGPSIIVGGGNEPSASGGGGGVGSSKMLPDFLSDGPIIHSSQRLADVAAGLPSNSIGSPEDSTMTSQLSRLRIENERLQRELIDARASLNEQTRRSNDLERQLLERHSNYNRSMPQNMTLAADEQKNKLRTAATQSHVTKLKQQVTQLTAEVETLRRENEVLREEGAVGGCSVPSCDRPYATAAAGVRGNNIGRPSRTQQISRDLLRAASNAENNLKQLLTGVDNLRQMAADIENSDLRVEYDVSPDLFSDFLDECDDYDDYPGGPAL